MKHPFQPVEDEAARLLILSTMPSPASMAAGGYYGHKRNAFWDVVGDLFQVDVRPGSWEDRYAFLRERGIALWDVLASCVRPGYADAAIRRPRPNDFARFLDDHPLLCAIFFNGTKAWQLWHGHVAPGLYGDEAAWEDPRVVDRQRRVWRILFRTLPSTSPRLTTPFDVKMRYWRSAFEEFQKVRRYQNERMLAVVR